MMHILINKLGGHRGAEAEGDVMALFVALFATAADEDYLMERFIRGLVKLYRLYSLGTDALAVADTALRFGAAYERAGFEMMHLPAFCLRFSLVSCRRRVETCADAGRRRRAKPSARWSRWASRTATGATATS